MKAVILAGGKGTRLGNLAQDIPKPMVRIGPLPILEHQINLLKKYGVKDIIILTCHLSGVIEKHFKDGHKFGVNISYFREKKPLGTTGGIKEIEGELTEDFLVFYGDVMLNLDLKKLRTFHKKKNGLATLVLHPNDHPFDSDLVEIDAKQRITAFYPKPRDDGKYYRNLVNAACYLISPKLLKYLEKDVKADFGKDVFPGLVAVELLYGYNSAEYLKDVGTPQRLKEVTQDYASGKLARLNSENKRPAIFLDRDGVINEEVNFLHKIDDFKLIPNVSKAVHKINHSEYLAIVATNQSVVARNLCSIEKLEEIHKKMETLLGNKRAKLDAIYYCPHHPDKGYAEENPQYKIECNCRKPKTGMLKMAMRDFNIDLKHSFFIGDSPRDILCGRKAGATTIAVRTGKGCKSSEIEPDYFFEDLREAVDFIVNEPLQKSCEKILRKVIKSPKIPLVITIGGVTRSGKTTLSRYLNHQLNKAGKKALIISLDNWILSREKRKKEHRVYDRFQLERIGLDILSFLEKKRIVKDKYDAITRKTMNKKVTYKLNDEDIVIIEGGVALSSAALRNISDLKIYCDINDKLLEERVLRFYSWKGLTRNSISKLFTDRKKDEYDLIRKDKAHADIIVKTNGEEIDN